MQKKISIITINWNNADGLRQTIESIIPQLTDACEFLIIDGASTDDSLDIIREYESSITWWISEEKGGIYADMNKGIDRATGEYCLFLNSGDWLNKDILSEAILECKGEDVIYFKTYLSYNNARFEEQTYPPNLTMRDFFKRTIGHQSTLIKRELFAKYGAYNEHNTIYSDYEFWIKSIVLGNATCRFVDQFLSYYDMGGRSSEFNGAASSEVDSILNWHLPKRVLEDYEYWYAREREMEILAWYKNRKWLYGALVFIYKIIKNVARLLNR